ncbi:MAG: ornithine cyclodeaminase family protein, partial [Alphaproteobacteria bacterium]|nr:ornithine cyclodeaminase family protein [Alphaproteobacteria bacterium]
QARSHLETFADLFPLKEVRAFGRGQANIDRVCEMARDKGLIAKACDTAHQAVQDADLIVSSVTLSFELAPFVDAGWLKPGAFATITDVAGPWIAESMPAFDTIVIDDQEQERASAKKMVDPGLVSGDLRDVVGGKIGEAFDLDKTCAFIFRGLAIGDFAVACLAYERALAAAKGTSVRW